MTQKKVWAIPLELSNYNVIVALLGGFISLFGLVSFLLKENFYLSESLISLLAGLAFGPLGANLIRPGAYVQCDDTAIPDVRCEASLNHITLNFSRLVLAIQLVLAGVQLPRKYLWKEYKPILLLIGPGMTCMWLATSLLVWGLADTPGILQALAIGACVTPTDPVLSAVIIKGKFANENVPKDLQDLVVAESGANDGLGYPFLFLALYLIKFLGPTASSGGAREAMGLWFAMTWSYTILLSIIFGAVVGYLAKELLRWAKERGYVDREAFTVFSIALALFVFGTCGLIGTDDLLACFIAGNAFTWDDWFRVQTLDDSLQPTMDMLLNVSIFLWYGASLPWNLFSQNSVISTGRLVALGLLVLLLRRLPWIYCLHWWIPQLRNAKRAVFVGFFGPMGVSAVFYLLISLNFIDDHLSDETGQPRSDVKNFGETMRVVVWFLVVCSTLVHGLSIPLGRVGYVAPKRIMHVFKRRSSDEPLRVEARSKIPVIGRYISRSASVTVDAWRPWTALELRVLRPVHWGPDRSTRTVDGSTAGSGSATPIGKNNFVVVDLAARAKSVFSVQPATNSEKGNSAAINLPTGAGLNHYGASQANISATSLNVSVIQLPN
ncbi:Na(+)/H(+) antiporter 2 [Ophiocordyceps camponoti-floridani]|uniref:Na(+)/H(+) antiporter 2 n=1 Tax=Ophiocordyceps camponoti-floridani TaxID=2030778 RepID=A0A8H4Q1C5_9HYPO|nr:Na(+)/H(+) antiporter 2 [Ophiocordyceps camponoti-floridani]